ncbi:antitoxin [Methylocystis rosea]|uniref:AbrB/MazE/SpoVT family DNA-binding domain-containing protein n=1 Tax=Methylocystis rosea TaxID=173366 RepID=A0A3G8M6T2_9HYPH|nr:AbrB/MazE/SpoVT family DNA-binding domain-containing protein [Methylocystis rosea]AZG77703.1 AbrB/MazE/SpoVT family DNA-binding domain-containing protein [Methylocystis rosea]
MSSTRIFKSGNSLAVRLPRGIAFDEGAEVVVRRQGGSLVVTPARLDMAELVARLKAAPPHTIARPEFKPPKRLFDPR